MKTLTPYTNIHTNPMFGLKANLIMIEIVVELFLDIFQNTFYPQICNKPGVKSKYIYNF